MFVQNKILPKLWQVDSERGNGMKYTIKWSTKPGMCAQYDGTVTVNATDDESAIDWAWRAIKRTFFDRSRAMFRFKIIEKEVAT
jgi:hypothetical protein